MICKLALRKQQSLQAMKQRNDDAAEIEQRERRFLAYGDGFYFNRHSTHASLESITRADLEAFHKRWFHPKNFVIAVNGDFDSAAMTARLEKLFAAWPFTGEVPPPVPTQKKFAAPGVYLVDKEVPQGRVTILLPGIQRDDPDFPATQVMNDILGGGGFTSRIMNRVRTEEGLAYSAGSSLSGGIYYAPPFMASFQSMSRKVPYATSLVLDEMKRIAAEPVTDEELQTSINAKVETFPRAFASKAQIAGMFASEEFTGRYAKNPDYFKNYRAKFRAITKADVQRIAARLLTSGQPTLLIVGQRDEILLGHPNHPQHLHDLGSKVTELPLRDPLTLEPQGQPKPIAKPEKN